MRSVLKERGQHEIRKKIELWLLTHKQILPKVTKAPFVNRENGANSIMVNLSITIKSTQFAGKQVQGVLFFEETKK